MEWPGMVHASEVQSRLIADGLPVERAMQVTSQLGTIPIGGRYKIERTQGDLYLYKTASPGYFGVATE